MPRKHGSGDVRRGLGSLVVTAVIAGAAPLAWSAPAFAADPPAFLGTLAGPSQAAMYPSGEEYDAVNDRLVIADTGRDRVLFYSLSGQHLGGFGTYGIAPGQFASPRDVTVDETGAIYVADAENNRIQKFSSTGTFLWERGGVGSGNNNLNTPIGVTWDAANDVVLVASTGQSLIKAFDANGNFAWKSPTGDALVAHGMRDVSRGPDGRLWVTAYKEHQIKVYDVSADGLTWNVTPVWVLGDGAASGSGAGQLNFPYNVAFSPGNQTVYVSDTGNGRIARWDISGAAPVWLPPMGDHCAAHPQPCADPPVDAGKFNHLRRVVVDSAGLIYGADFWGAGIEVFDPAGASVSSIEGDEPPTPGFSEAYSIDIAPSGQIYVMDRLNHRIQRFTAAGAYLNKVGARGTQPATFSWPEAVTVAPNGRVWAVDTRGDRIEDFPADLATTPTVQSYGSTGSGVGQFNYPEGADVGTNGVVWVADTRNDRLHRYDPVAGTFSVVGGPGTGPGQFNDPMGVAVTASAVFVADTGNNRIQKLALDGTHLATYATGLSGPEGLEVAPDGTIWVADTQNSRVVHLSADLGTDLGDGFGALGTGDFEFFNPHDVAVGNGKLYVADTYNSRVQIYSLPTTPPPALVPTYRTQIAAEGGHAPFYPAGTAIVDGTWYVADSGGSRIVTVDPVTSAVAPLTSTGLTDPRDLEMNVAEPSTLWVTDTGGNRLVKLARTGGAQISTITGLTQPYGLANDANRVYVANTYANTVRAYTQAGAAAWTQTTCGGKAFSRPRDVGITDGGLLAVADTDNDRIVLLNAATGACSSTFGTRGTGAGQFKSPRSVTSDGSGGLWVADAFNYRVQHLTTTGASLGATPVDAYGDAPDQFRSAHCVTKVPGTTRVAVCDTFNFRVSVFDGAGATPTLVNTIGGTKPAQGGFNGPFGVAYGPGGELYVADWFNHRIQKFDADGNFVSQWGAYGSQNGSLIFPRNVVVDPSGNVVVTDSENNRIDVFTSAGSYVRQTKPLTGTALNRPHQTALDGTGGYWIADTNNNRVVHLASTGTVLGSFQVPGAKASKPQGIALDLDGTLLVSNSENNVVQRYTSAGVLVGPVAGTGTSIAVTKPAGLLVTGSGADKRVWITDISGNRVVVLDAAGSRETSFGAGGAGSGQFTQPRGIAVDPTDGQMAVADFGNDRISLWDPTGPPPPVDVADPTVTVTTPGAGASVPSGTVSVSGTAADDLAVAAVDVAVQRASDGLWLQSNGTWGAAQAFASATLSATGTPATDWSYSFAATSGGHTLTVRVTDGVAKTGQTTRSFTVTAPDTTAPDTTATGPAATIDPPTATAAGSASDNVGVASVTVLVKNRDTNLWLKTDGTWGSTTAGAQRLAVLANPGAGTTAWSLDIPLGPGNYQITARARDAAGNQDATAASRNFTVRSADTVAPDGTMSSPANNATVPMGPVSLQGAATDNVGVASVALGIQDTVTKQWLRPDGTWSATYTTIQATLANPGAASTTWQFTFTPPIARKYGVSVIAKDTSNNTDGTKPWVQFTVS